MTQTTSIATREPKAPLVAGGSIAAIIPRTLEETFRLAGAVHASGLAPATLKTPEMVMVAIMAGAELGLAPFQSLQSFAVINGRPAIWGDGLMAVVRSQGFRVKEWMEGEGDGLVARCEVTRPDNGEITSASFSVAKARKAGLWAKAGPWTQYPERMLQMRARAFALRDGAADVLRGFQIREEVEDYAPVRDATPQQSGVMARLAQHGTPDSPGFTEGHVDAETGRPLAPEIVDAIIETAAHDSETGEVTETAQTADDDFPGDRPRAETETGYGGAGDDDEPDPGSWCRDQLRLIDEAASTADLDRLRDAPDAGERFAALQAFSASDAKTLQAAMTGKRKALKDREQAA